MSPDTVETMHGIIVALLSGHLIYSIVITFFEFIYVQYEEGFFHNPSNVFQKIFNFIAKFLFGLTPYIYRKLLKYPWIKRRLYMLLITLLMLSMYIPTIIIIGKILDFIFLDAFLGETIHGIVMMGLLMQIIFSFFTFLSNFVYKLYEDGIFQNPANPLQKISNLSTKLLFGLGPYIYRKLLNLSIFKRKSLMLLATVLMFVIYIPVYFISEKCLNIILQWFSS